MSNQDRFTPTVTKTYKKTELINEFFGFRLGAAAATAAGAQTTLNPQQLQWKSSALDLIAQETMCEVLESEREAVSEQRAAQPRQEASFHYQMVDMKARKIATIIKISRLPYLLEQVTEPEARPYLLKTQQGQLYQEYEIITYIVNDSFARTFRQNGSHASHQQVQSLTGPDIFLWAKMNEHLFELRRNLFPMLEEFYRYLLGHEKVRRSKYEALGNKIRKQILRLDQLMNEHSQLFRMDHSFLNLIIVCELWIGCKFAFEEKFRKSKLKLFSKCEKISKSPEFQDIYGKASFCVRECLPVEFLEEQQAQSKKQEAIHIQLAKIAEPWAYPVGNDKRNELLYNFFKSTFKGHQPKLNYFPYFWLMYDNLLCTLVEFHYEPAEHADHYSELEKGLVVALQELGKIIKLNLDYGFLGIYLNQKTCNYKIHGLICLGEHTFDEFTQEMGKYTCLKKFKAVKVDVQSEEQRRKVEMLWEYQMQGMSFQGIKVSLIREF